MTLKVSANRLGITIVARAARIAAGTDHTGTKVRDHSARNQAGRGAALAESVIRRSVRSESRSANPISRHPDTPPGAVSASWAAREAGCRGAGGGGGRRE